MSGNRQKVGRKGEDEACLELERLGHSIVCRNWRWGHLELDIISLDPQGGLHIVEVKTLVAPVAAAPYEKVDRQKMRRMSAAANAFLNSKDRAGLPADLEVFFDVMSVVFDGPNFEIEYYPQAFIPIYD